MNSADSERMAGVLEAAGYACSTEAGEADVLIYNTCSIREKAEQKVYSALGKQVGQRQQLVPCWWSICVRREVLQRGYWCAVKKEAEPGRVTERDWWW